jgi:acyl-CoA reductase-like NAD-dependent aldehyde dehydrogenase
MGSDSLIRMATVEQSTAEITVENPATGAVIRTVPAASADDVRAMVARAREVQPAWEALGFEGRGRILRRAQKWVVDNAERLIETIVSESGKTYEDAQLAEAAYAAHALGFWAKKAPDYLAEERIHTSNPFVLGRKLVLRYRPLGVIGVIGPWNYPFNNNFGDCIPALAAGNTAVLKPSSVTPLTSMLMLECMRESGMPKGVFQVANGGAETAQSLIDEVDLIMFTGSTETGKKVMERAARTLTPVSLELGGKDPMIVLADADLERAANAASFYSMQNGGQTCISVERVYVEAPVYDEFVNRLTAKVRGLRQGPPAGPGSVEVGAMTFRPQLDVVREHVDQAREAGAQVLVGGSAHEDGGAYFEPTVIAGADHSMACMTEETFGPTVAVMKVADAEEAIRLANDSPYGLQASVYTRDVARGEQIARRIECGAVCVNDALLNYVATELPMGGWKESGMGVRHGAAGIRKYTRQQSLLVTRLAPKRDLHMFPYKANTTRLLGRAVKLMYGRGKRD